MNWLLVVWDGYSTIRKEYSNVSYDVLANRARAYPPGYIWHIEKIESI